MVLIVFLMGTTAHASTLQNEKDVIEVEILVNSIGEDFAENIVFDDGTKLSDYEYTVKYAPMPRGFYPIADYFNYAAWITKESGEIALSLDPKESVRSTSVARDAAWNVISSTRQGFASSPKWKNTQVMKWQFECHYWFAENKDFWNLEPHRTASSYLTVVAFGCNP